MDRERRQPTQNRGSRRGRRLSLVLRMFADRNATVWFLAVMMATTGALLALPDVLRFIAAGLPEAQWWALLPLFAIAEVLVIHLPTLRNAHSHTVREVPAVVGLAFLAPGEYVAAYVLAAGAALLFGRKQRGLKLAFNVSMFTLEATLGFLTYQAVVDGAAPGSLRAWAAAFAAVLVTDLVSAVAVTAAISLTEDRFDRETLREAAGPGLVAAVVNTCMALLVVVLIIKEPIALPLVGVMLLMLVVAYRAHVALGAGYSRLQHLYQFVGSAERPADADRAIETVLRDARQVLRADRAELIVLPAGTEPGTRVTMSADAAVVHGSYPGANPELDAWWAPAALGEAVLRSSAPTSPQDSSSSSPRDGVAAPLHAEGTVYAVLSVSDRSFQGQTFTVEDLRLFETLAAHAAVALDKARLLDRLRRIAAEREHEARHDPLTGLPNRRAFHEAVTALTAQAGTGAVFFLDLDDFKDVNDTLGHDAGDALLHQTGARLQAACAGMVARLGGDEFAVLLPGICGDQALLQARDLLSAVGRPVSLHPVTLLTKVSIGIALLPDHGTDTNEILRHADVAMYEAKRAGTGVEMYRPEDGRAVARKLVLAGDLPAAIESHRFAVCYQPQADAATGRIVGAEALLRWKHPTYGHIPPPEIVSLAERIGCLRLLTNAVLEDALHQRATWAASGFDLNISVNVTALDLADEGLPDVVSVLLASTGTPAPALTLEITEQSVMGDPERCLAVLDRLAELGIRLSVDDFGTGYSSLAYLERLPVHEVKIDRSFVQRLEQQKSDTTVIGATVTLAHDLGMHVVAEGVETRTAWARVAALGCELVQGYVLSRPLAAQDTIPWLQHSAHSIADPSGPTPAAARRHVAAVDATLQ